MNVEAATSKQLLVKAVKQEAELSGLSVSHYCTEKGVNPFFVWNSRENSSFSGRSATVDKLKKLLPELSSEHLAKVPHRGGGQLTLTEGGKIICESIQKKYEERFSKKKAKKVAAKQQVKAKEKEVKKNKVPAGAKPQAAPVKIQTNIPLQVLGDLLAISRDGVMSGRILRVLDYLEPAGLSLADVLRAADVQAGHAK